MTTMDMSVRAARKWAEELRSFPQDQLKNGQFGIGGRVCAVGALMRAFLKDTQGIQQRLMHDTRIGWGVMKSPEFAMWLGDDPMADRVEDGYRFRGMHPDLQEISDMNDSGQYSFKQLADHVEKTFLKPEVKLSKQSYSQLGFSFMPTKDKILGMLSL